MTAAGRSKWSVRICAALERLGGEAKLSDLYARIERDVTDPLPSKWQSAVRRTLQIYCSESRYFTGTRALFEHKKPGVWALKKRRKSAR